MDAGVAHGTDDRAPRPNGTGAGKNSNNSIHLDLTTIRSFFSGAISQIQSKVTLDTIRPLNMFLGISGQNMCFSREAFGPPVKKLDKSTLEKFKSRLKLNFAFFLSNYAVMAVGVSLVIALMHPGMLISVLVLWGLWSLHGFLINNELVISGKNVGTLISIKHRSQLLSIVTVLVVVWKCLKPTISAIAISGVLIMSHAILRDPKHIDAKSATGERKDSDDEGTSSDSEVIVERPQVRKDVV